MTIGLVADQAGVNIQTVRFYERKGLIPQAPRSAGGYRQYDEDAVKRILFIKHALDRILEALDEVSFSVP